MRVSFLGSKDLIISLVFFRTYYYLFKWCYRVHASQSQRNISLSQEIYTCLSPKRNPTSFPNFFRFVQIISPPEKTVLGCQPRCLLVPRRGVTPWNHASWTKNWCLRWDERWPGNDGIFLEIRHTHQLRLSFSFSVGGGPRILMLFPWWSSLISCIAVFHDANT